MDHVRKRSDRSPVKRNEKWKPTAFPIGEEVYSVGKPNRRAAGGQIEKLLGRMNWTPDVQLPVGRQHDGMAVPL